MKNGDRVTGSIVKKDGKNLKIQSDYFGVITTVWDQVDSIKTDKPIHVVLQDGRSINGTLETTKGKVEVIRQSGRVSISPADITSIRDEDEQRAYERFLRPGWVDVWAGTASIGLAGTSGNARALTFTTDLNAARLTNTDKTSVHFSAIKASAVVDARNGITAQAVRGGLAYNHNVSSTLFINVFNDYEYDRFQNLDLRLVAGGGLGLHAIKTERTRLDLLAGLAFNRSSFTTPSTRKSVEIDCGNEYSLKLTGTTSLVQSFRVFNDRTHTGVYRVNADISVATKFSRWLVWNISLSDRYFSDPAPGRKTNDFLYTTGLGLTFSR